MDYSLPSHFLLQQADKASHVIDQIHHPDLDGCAGLANRPQLLTALLGDRTKHMLDSGTVSGAPGVGPSLRFGQRSVAVGAFMYPVTVPVPGATARIPPNGKRCRRRSPRRYSPCPARLPDTGCHAPRHRSRRTGESAYGACPH